VLAMAVAAGSFLFVPAAGQEPIARAAAPATAPAVTDAQIAAARKYARSRGPSVAFAVVESPRGRPRGLHRYVTYKSASVTKAMLMVAVMRRAGKRPLSKFERALLKPMITASDNDAASIVFRQVGGATLRAVARAAGMHRFDDR